MSQIVVNLVSESEFTVQGHGVHTAYMEMRHLLESQPDIRVMINSKPAKATDITHIHTFGPFALVRLLSCKGGKKVVSAHVVPDSLIGSIVGAKVWIKGFKYYLRWFYNRANLVIAVSPSTRDNLIKLGVKRPIAILDNTIDTTNYINPPAEKSLCRKRLHLPINKFIVVGNGQIQPRKRFDTFAQVAKKMPNLQFIWVGGIPFKAAGAGFIELEKLIKNAPVNLIVTDVIPQEEARIYMKASDIMFMPSEQETFGLAIVEGAACGMPVIVRDIHDYDATFGGLVIRDKEETGFIDTINRLANDKNYYETWVRKSKKLAKKYDSARNSPKLISLYRRLISR